MSFDENKMFYLKRMRISFVLLFIVILVLMKLLMLVICDLVVLSFEDNGLSKFLDFLGIVIFNYVYYIFDYLLREFCLVLLVCE